MPIYAYRCAECGHAKDVLQKLSDPLLTTCPACGAEAFGKQLTAAGFQLKGSGWYATDFKGGSPAAAPKDKPSDGGKGDGKGDAKPDGKPADSKPADSKPADSKSAGGKTADGAPSASGCGGGCACH